MDIKEDKARGTPKHLRYMDGVAPTITEQLREPLMVLLEHMRFEIRNFIRSLGAREVQDKWSFDDRHLDDPQFVVRSNELGHVMSRDIVDSSLRYYVIHFKLAKKASGLIEEFHRGNPIRALDEAVLTDAGTQGAKQVSVVASFELLDARIGHAIFPQHAAD